MRIQQIITIDAFVEKMPDEAQLSFARRQDHELTKEIVKIQANPAWQDWDLLSVAPAGSHHPNGYYLSVWELDDDRYNDEAQDSVAQDDCAIGPEEGEVGEGVPTVRFGGQIEVNGKRFNLVGFHQDDSYASVEFMDVDLMHDERPIVLPRVPQSRIRRYAGGARATYAQPQFTEYNRG